MLGSIAHYQNGCTVKGQNTSVGRCSYVQMQENKKVGERGHPPPLIYQEGLEQRLQQRIKESLVYESDNPEGHIAQRNTYAIRMDYSP